MYKGGLLLLLSLFIIIIIKEWGERRNCVYIIMYKDGLLFLGKTHINNSCRARRPLADNNKNKNNDINNSYQDRRPPDQKDMIIHIKQSEKRQYRQKQL